MNRRDMSTLSLVTQLGLTVVTALILSLLLGIWLDSVLGTRPILTLVFSLIGIFVGTFGVYRLVTRAIAESVESTPRTRRAEGEARPADAAAPNSRQVDPRADEEDEDERDPWEDEEATEKRRARQEETERRLGLRPPSVKPTKPEEEQK